MKKTYSLSEIKKAIENTIGQSESPTLPVKYWNVEAVFELFKKYLFVADKKGGE